MSPLTQSIRQQISTGVGNWGDELMVPVKGAVAEIPAAGDVGSADVQRLTGAIMLELCTIVSALLLAALEEKPDWVQAGMWGSAAVKVIVPKIQERESTLAAQAIKNNVDAGKYAENLASSPQVQAKAKEWGFTTQKETRDAIRSLADDLATKHRQFITAAAPLAMARAFDVESLSRLEEFLEGRASKRPVLDERSQKASSRQWWQFWR